MGPGGHQEGSWRPLGALEEAWSAKGRLPGAYGALLDASWPAPGAARTTIPHQPILKVYCTVYYLAEQLQLPLDTRLQCGS